MKKSINPGGAFALAVLALGVAAVPAQASDINLSGFLSLGAGWVDDKNAPAYNGYGEEDITFDNSLLGLQVSGQVTERLTATVQLIARGGNEYDVKAEWAYLSWQLDDQSKLRFGRLRTPFYMYSDFLDLGYAYTWISPPAEVYYLPFNNVSGVDYYSTFTLGSFDASVQAYIGAFNDNYDLNDDGIEESAKTRNQVGLAATLGKDWWTLRAAYHQADLSLDVTAIPAGGGTTLGDFATNLTLSGFADNANRLLLEEDRARFLQLGGNLDTGRFVAAAEYVEFEAEDSLLSKNVRQYVMGGVRFNTWLLHLTFAQSKDEAADLSSGIPPSGATAPLIGALDAIAATQVSRRDVISLGTRWDVASGTAIKFQIDDVDNKHGPDQRVFAVALQAVF